MSEHTSTAGTPSHPSDRPHATNGATANNQGSANGRPAEQAQNTLTPPRPAQGEIVPNPNRGPNCWPYLFRWNAREWATDAWTIDADFRRHEYPWLDPRWERDVNLIPLDITIDHLEHWLDRAPHDLWVNEQMRRDPCNDDHIPTAQDYVFNASLMLRQLGLELPAELRIVPENGYCIEDRQWRGWLHSARIHLLHRPRDSDEGDELSASDSTIWFDPDYRMCRWGTEEWRFTTMQAACVRVMEEARKQGVVEMSAVSILDQAGSAQKASLSSVFKRTGKYAPCWGTMIVKGTRKGMYRLENPPKTQKTRQNTKQ